MAGFASQPDPSKTEGQTKRRQFASAQAASQDVAKLIAQKTNKGYQAV
jgi:predicted DNA-binding WGR domain protein